MHDQADLKAKLTQTAATAGARLLDAQIDRLASYLSSLERWNRTINLTALELQGFPESTLRRLIGEPLEGASLISVGSGRWFDLGSGCGSPAVPMAVALPQLELVMVESRGRKAAFLREAARVTGLPNATVLADRINTVATREARGCASLVSLRAIRIDRDVSAAIDHLLSQSGELLLFGSDDWPHLSASFVVARTLGCATLLRRSAFHVER